MLTEREQQFSNILASITESLDIPDSKYGDAVSRYKAVGKWLEDGVYPGVISRPKVYPQGSFRLGTVVRPITEEDPYDIDLVCQLEIEKIMPIDLKYMVRDRLMKHDKYNRMLDKKEGRRCWTLNYAEDDDGLRFHMDILPSVPDDPMWKQKLVSVYGIPYQYAEHAISITNKDKDSNKYTWSKGNPEGYAEWFDEKKRLIYVKIEKRQRELIFEKYPYIYASVEQVPKERVKTPLQMAVQILKRHRDLRFSGKTNSEDKPISIVITTLSATAYKSESDPYTALMNIVNALISYESITEQYKSAEGLIEKRAGRWYIPNPVDPAENFAEFWHENNHAKARAFFQWLKWLQTDINTAFSKQGLNEIAEALIPSLGNQPVKEAMAKMATSYRKAGKNGLLTTAGTGILSISGSGIRNPRHNFHGPCS
jgi:hypothetical protein